MAAVSARSPSDAGAADRTVDAEAYLREAAALVEAYLERVLPAPGGHIPRLAEAVRYSALGGGKRLRPALALGAAEASGGARELALPVAAAVEMIHTYSLIHDDLPAMDDDDFRRGRPTSHKVFGEAVAILAGDALLTQAFEVLAADGSVSPERRVAIVREIAVAGGPAGLVGGQVADIEGEGRDLTLPELEFIHARKTGALILASVRGGAIAAGALERLHRAKTGALLSACVRGGAVLGGAGEEDLGRLSRYASAIGLAFQVVDDVLDATEDATQLGKTAGKDEAARKATYVSVHGLERAREMAAALRQQALDAVSPLGPRGELLGAIARLIVDRRS
jgi:geranylgeranyl diphosphate synthase type II